MVALKLIKGFIEKVEDRIHKIDAEIYHSPKRDIYNNIVFPDLLRLEEEKKRILKIRENLIEFLLDEIGEDDE